MEVMDNGLDIAEADLQLRGAGSVFNAGIKQSGRVLAHAHGHEHTKADKNMFVKAILTRD